MNSGEEVTVERLYREGNRIKLKPQNVEHEDLVKSAEDVRVQGRVTCDSSARRGSTWRLTSVGIGTFQLIKSVCVPSWRYANCKRRLSAYVRIR